VIELVGGAVALTAVAYSFGRMRGETADGCNGHHWGEPYRPDEDGVSRPERERAGLDRETVHKPSNHYTAKVLTDSVVLRGKAIKKCQDCGELKVVDITVGSLDIDAFEE